MSVTYTHDVLVTRQPDGRTRFTPLTGIGRRALDGIDHPDQYEYDCGTYIFHDDMAAASAFMALLDAQVRVTNVLAHGDPTIVS